MTSKKLKFNVIIPTRERKDTLSHCLRTVIAQDYENLNIIVSDNSSADGTFDVVKSFIDSRIQYINTGSRMSMSHNWEFALNHVTDGWVMYIGDDDGLCPGAIELLNDLIQEYKVEAVSADYGTFIWPDHFKNYQNGALAIPLMNSVVVKNSRFEVEKVFAGKLPYQKLPWLYHGGAASIDLINRLRDKNGRFFCSQIPDIYSAVALSLATEKFLAIGIPLVIAGSSQHSNGASASGAISVKGGNPFAQFNAENNIPIHASLAHASLVYRMSLQVIIYECYLQSWHIHEGQLGILLEDQLRVAIRLVPASHRDQIRKECQMVAAKSGRPFDDRYSKSSRFLDAIFRLPVTLRKIFMSLQIEPKKMGLKNIYDAANASSYLYKFTRSRVHILILLGIENLIKHTVSKVKRTS